MEGVVWDLTGDDDQGMRLGDDSGGSVMFNNSDFLNLSEEAGISPSVAKVGLIFEFGGHCAILDRLCDSCSSKSSFISSQRSRAPAPSTSPSPIIVLDSPPREKANAKPKVPKKRSPAASAEPKKKKARKATPDELMASMLVQCGDLIVSPAFWSGMEASLFPASSVRENLGIPEQCIVFSIGEETLPHVVRLMSARELSNARDSLDAFVASLQEFRNRVTLIIVGKSSHLLDTITRLQVVWGINVRPAPQSADVGAIVGRIARALALNSAKSSDSSLGAVNVMQGGRGVKNSADAREQWTNMLVAIPQMSRQKASAIVIQFPKLADLISELRRNGAAGLAEIRCGEQRLGKVLAMRIQTVFTSRNPHEIVQGGGEKKK